VNKRQAKKLIKEASRTKSLKVFHEIEGSKKAIRRKKAFFRLDPVGAKLYNARCIARKMMQGPMTWGKMTKAVGSYTGLVEMFCEITSSGSTTTPTAAGKSESQPPAQ
jgi:hypothetical protein